MIGSENFNLFHYRHDDSPETAIDIVNCCSFV